MEDREMMSRKPEALPKPSTPLTIGRRSGPSRRGFPFAGFADDANFAERASFAMRARRAQSA